METLNTEEALAEIERARNKATWGCVPVHRLIPHIVTQVMAGIYAGAIVWGSDDEKVTVYGVQLG